ncbi:HEAT repeat domain-containing protein [Actinoallomurus acaciae]|uniref:HEAT repeat domain-containing protein n=1 Tax=Actinoallomurus acaciae TaxID=502577 RepID=A0ABV5YA80_9ACTN
MEPAVEDLVGRAVALARDLQDGDDYEAVWEVLREVAADGPASLRAGTDLLASSDPVARSVGCDLLGCAGDLHEAVRADAASALLTLAPAETDADVTWSIAQALGSTYDRRAVPVLASLAAHPDADVRLKTAQALPSMPPEEAVIGALIRLTADEDPQVRNWATFGLGSQVDADTPAVREALRARLGDDGEDVRAEAVFGLARRRDPRATARVIELLEAEQGIFSWGLEAAACLRDPALLPYLTGYDAASPPVAAALRECDPAARRRRDDFAAALLHSVYDRSPAAGAAVFSTLLETGLTLRTADAVGTRVWSVEALMERAGGDPRRAADVVTRESV